jgi:hypothetical protein
MYSTARNYLQLIRFSHTIFALPFALLGAVLAWAQPGTVFRWQDLLGILVCMVAARSAAMAFNRLVDRRIDALNPRTATRHLPAGLLSVRRCRSIYNRKQRHLCGCHGHFSPEDTAAHLIAARIAVPAGVFAGKAFYQFMSLLAVSCPDAVTCRRVDRCQE